MLRTRLLYGLLTLVVLLWAVGAAGWILLRESERRAERKMEIHYPDIKTARAFRTITSTLNTRYLPQLAGPPAEEAPDRAIFDELKLELEAHIAELRRSENNDKRWSDVVIRLEQTLKGYFEGYERLFRGGDTARSQREELLLYLSNQTQRITDLSENALTLAEERMAMNVQLSASEGRKNLLFISTLVLLGTAIAVIIYFQLVRHLVDPVVGLQRSIDEIRLGNFELVLPEPGFGSEFRSVVAAFNDMAAELRLRRGETDERLMRTNLVNRAILEAIPSPVYVLDDEGHTLQLNPAAERLNDRLGLANRLPSKIQRIVEECRQKGRNHMPEDPREALLFRLEEREFYYLPRIFRFAEDGAQSGIAVLLHNVTRIRWLDDVKTNLLSTVSHEIKTPLTGIRMVLHLLLEERTGALSDRQRTMISSASEDCERLLATLNSLLDLSRAESGTTHLDRGPISITEVVERVTELFRAKAAGRGITIVKEVPEGLPEVLADPLRLDEVVNNLLSNAIKHGPDGQPVTVRVGRADSDHLRVSVIDRGPGVPEEVQDRIFERFFRAPGQEVEGVGLGLFISREIMRAHEGRIGLRERSGDQTEFYIDVPIA